MHRDVKRYRQGLEHQRPQRNRSSAAPFHQRNQSRPCRERGERADAYDRADCDGVTAQPDDIDRKENEQIGGDANRGGSREHQPEVELITTAQRARAHRASVPRSCTGPAGAAGSDGAAAPPAAPPLAVRSAVIIAAVTSSPGGSAAVSSALPSGAV